MTDVLSERLGLGQALGGTILLAIATNLPVLFLLATLLSGEAVLPGWSQSAAERLLSRGAALHQDRSG